MGSNGVGSSAQGAITTANAAAATATTAEANSATPRDTPAPPCAVRWVSTRRCKSSWAIEIKVNEIISTPARQVTAKASMVDAARRVKISGTF